MIKHILNRLPRKPSKTVENHEGGGMSTSSSTASTSARSSDLAGYRYGNSTASSLSGLNSNSSLGLNPGDKFLQAVNSKLNGNLSASSYEALPSFRDIPNSEKHNMFIRKLQMCCVVFDFTDPTKNFKEKDIKRQTLLELVDYVSSANGKFTETMMQEIVKMVSINLFRTLTSPPRENKVLEAFDLEEEEPSMDPSWPHLRIVYELLLKGLWHRLVTKKSRSESSRRCMCESFSGDTDETPQIIAPKCERRNSSHTTQNSVISSRWGCFHSSRKLTSMSSHLRWGFMNSK